MSATTKFEDFLVTLHEKIEQNPTEKYRIILQELRETECPYLKKKIKSIYY